MSEIKKTFRLTPESLEQLKQLGEHYNENTENATIRRILEGHQHLINQLDLLKRQKRTLDFELNEIKNVIQGHKEATERMNKLWQNLLKGKNTN